jgi:siroheme decarboxylase
MLMANEGDARLIAAIQDGLPLVARPYAAVGARLGMTESEVMARIKALQDDETIKRFGVVVRHHELGYCANAMVVWDVPDEQVKVLGARIAQQDGVTLCYRRARQLPQWRYNLYCMIHGRSRTAVLEQIARLIDACGLQELHHEVLFSARRFKQRGARYANAAPAQRLKRAVGA